MVECRVPPSLVIHVPRSCGFSLPVCAAFILTIAFMHTGEHVKNMKNMQFGQSLKVRERAHANNPRLNQMSAAVEVGGLSRGGGACPMCRLMERRGAQRSDDVRT